MTSVGTVISFPVPPYQNLPIEANFYQPSRFVISAISLGISTIITTSTAHNYTIGQIVRLLIPAQFGSYQLNDSQGYVLSIPSTTQVEVSINSIMNVNAFISSTATTASPQILAIGDQNSGATNANPVSSNLNIPG